MRLPVSASGQPNRGTAAPLTVIDTPAPPAAADAADVAGAGAIRRTPRPAWLAGLLRRWAWGATLAGLCGVLLLPLCIVDVPPLVDYPNHLGRAFVLASLPGDTVLASFYAVHWAIIPNLAIDLLAPPLIRVMPVHVAGRLLIALAVLLPVLGAIAYSRVLGSRWWCLAAGLVAYNLTLLEGFLNFCLGIGLALLLAAAWMRWRDSRPAAAIGLAMAGAVALFACHLMGLLFFAGLLLTAELARLLPNRGDRSAHPRPADSQHGPRTLPHLAIRRTLPLLAVFAAPALLYFASPLRDLGDDAEFLSPGAKFAQMLAPFSNYSTPLDILTAVAALGFVTVCLLLRRGTMPMAARLAVGGLAVAYLAAPYAWKGTSQLDLRFTIMLGFMLFAGFVPRRWPAWLGRLAGAAVALLFLARMALLTTAWAQHATDVADLRRVLAPVLPGQAVYVASVRPVDPAAYWAAAPLSRRLANGAQTDAHIGALALIERRAWWPFEFDMPSQQPLVTREPYHALAVPIGDLPDRTRLLAANLCGFDVALLTQADAAPDLPAPRFRLLTRAGFAALYAIDDCHPPP